MTCGGLCSITTKEWCNNFLSYHDDGCKGDPRCIGTVCKEAMRCEGYQNADQATTESGGDFCPRIFDGWVCVNTTKAGENATFDCPPFNRLLYTTAHKAHRSCAINGSWWDEDYNRPWTNYDDCPDSWSGWFALALTKVYVTGYGVSLAFLSLATFTFLYFRSLRCVRNKVHTHLFISLILNNFTWILWYVFVVWNVSTGKWSEIAVTGCRTLHFFTHYFMVATYMWMLCEGVYLFLILVITFFSEQNVVKILYILGWGLPFVLVFSYTVLRAALEDSFNGEV